MDAKHWISRPIMIAAAGAAMVLAGCGGGGGGSDNSGIAAPAIQATGQTAPSGQSAPAPQAVPAAQSAVSQFLTLDPSQPPNYDTLLPPHFEAAMANDNTPKAAAANVSVIDTINLGRVLFYDKSLSVNGTVACASCHQQDAAFSDTRRFSLAFNGTDVGTRHAMRLANLRFFKAGTMFWDKRAASLEAQSVMPIQNPVEMGFDSAHGGLTTLMDKMNGLPYYPELFSRAFGDAAISQDRIQAALAEYMRRIVSVNSRWDSGYAQVFDSSLPDKGLDKDIPDFTPQENRGRHLFMASAANGGLNCAACHVPPSFALGGSGSNGLDAGETTSFKSPSLKNVAQSTSFMHDGRFSSLEQVIEHYNSGVQDGPALDKRLKDADGQPLVLNLSDDDKAALVAFLKTLSDPVLASNPAFSNPFRP